MTAQEESRLYRALMSYNSAYNDFLSGSLIDRSNFKNLYGIIYFDQRNQDEDTCTASRNNRQGSKYSTVYSLISFTGTYSKSINRLEL